MINSVHIWKSFFTYLHTLSNLEIVKWGTLKCKSGLVLLTHFLTDALATVTGKREVWQFNFDGNVFMMISSSTATSGADDAGANDERKKATVLCLLIFYCFPPLSLSLFDHKNWWCVISIMHDRNTESERTRCIKAKGKRRTVRHLYNCTT